MLNTSVLVLAKVPTSYMAKWREEVLQTSTSQVDVLCDDGHLIYSALGCSRKSYQGVRHFSSFFESTFAIAIFTLPWTTRF